MKISSKSFKILVAIAVLSAAAMVAAFCFTGSEDGVFTPPPFESEAVAGVPCVPDELGYGDFGQDGMAYRFFVCGNVIAAGGEATVYFTNPAENSVWLKLRVLDKNGEILGETGLLKPGEYVESVAISGNPKVGAEITLKVMGYEPETYHSAGAVSLRTKIAE